MPTTTPEDPESNEEETPELDEIEVAVVDEIVLERTDESVESRVEPASEPSRVSSARLTVPTLRTDTVELSRVEHTVESQVRPESVVTETETEDEITGTVETQIPVAESVEVERLSHEVSQTVVPAEQLEEREEFEITTVQPSVEKMENSVSQQIEPLQDMSTEPVEPDEEDPVFAWGGGTPYGSRRPKLVIHKNRKNEEEVVDTLPFLQVLLRDTYTEMNGGEPDADTVEFVGNEPRSPSVQDSIVTLDLTDGGWKAELNGDEPSIRRNSTDIVPKLREVASTLYTGETGYFVVDAPAEWEYEADTFGESFFEKLVAHLTRGSIEEEDDTDAGFERAESPPVVVAEPRFEDDAQEGFATKVSRYFGFNRGSNVDVRRTEAENEHVLRKNDWKRIALTERQSTGDGESDEHYFWKATMVEGVAREMFKLYRETEAYQTDEMEGFSNFVEEKLLGDTEVIDTEHGLGGGNDEKSEPVADVRIGSPNDWATQGAELFLSQDDGATFPVCLEFETGRGEGAFNFRKVRETLEKYENVDEFEAVYVVVPPRLLFRGRRRASMISSLVESWSEQTGKEARAYVPVLNSSYCRTLERVEQVVDEIYGGEE